MPRWFIAASWAPRATAATSMPAAGPCAARRAARCPPTAPAPKTTTRIVDGWRRPRVAAAPASGLPERGDAVDPADEQHALLVDARIAQAVGRRLARVLRPDLVELLRDARAARLPLALF